MGGEGGTLEKKVHHALLLQDPVHQEGKDDEPIRKKEDKILRAWLASFRDRRLGDLSRGVLRINYENKY